MVIKKTAIVWSFNRKQESFVESFYEQGCDINVFTEDNELLKSRLYFLIFREQALTN